MCYIRSLPQANTLWTASHLDVKDGEHEGDNDTGDANAVYEETVSARASSSDWKRPCC